jgi:hypothetical protein
MKLTAHLNRHERRKAKAKARKEAKRARRAMQRAEPKFPTPKKAARPVMMQRDSRMVIEALRAENTALAKKLTNTRQRLDIVTAALLLISPKAALAA